MGAPFTAMSAALRRRIALFCLVLAVALLFHRVLLGEGVLYFRDVCLNHLPTRLYTTEILRSGHLPLWNPHLSGGMPLAANPNNLMFHPITVLFLMMPVMAAFHVSILLQYLLAGWGLFLWGREEGLGEESALAGALTYSLSGVLVSCGSLQNLLSSWAWVPLALFALARHRRRGSPWALLGFSAALAVQLLAGDPLAAGTSLLLGLMDTIWGRGAAGRKRLLGGGPARRGSPPGVRPGPGADPAREGDDRRVEPRRRNPLRRCLRLVHPSGASSGDRRPVSLRGPHRPEGHQLLGRPGVRERVSVSPEHLSRRRLPPAGAVRPGKEGATGGRRPWEGSP